MCSRPQQPTSTRLHRRPREPWEKNTYVRETAESDGAEWELGTLMGNGAPPCVFGSVCGPWTQSAESSMWGQSSPRTPLDSAGRNLGMTILCTVIKQHYSDGAKQSGLRRKSHLKYVCTWVRRIIFIFQLKFHQQFENSPAKKKKDGGPWSQLISHFPALLENKRGLRGTLHWGSSCVARESGRTERERRSAAPGASFHMTSPRSSAGMSHTPTTAS